LEKDAEYTARAIEQQGDVLSFDFCRRGEVLCRVRVKATGRHNVYNALAAAAACSLCGISPDRIAAGLESYRGAHRRMELRGKLPSGAMVYDDYGHHPDEIRATLSGARSMGAGRILCAYQPHTYSRTAGLFDEFAGAFADADRVYLVDIYAAREQNVYGVSSEMLAERIGEKACYCDSFASLAATLTADARKDDLVIVMGAGDIFRVYDLLEFS